MKKILLLLSLIMVMACQDNFDEWNDTSQRYVELDIDISHLFDGILVQEGSQFKLQSSSVVNPDGQIRVSVYCYDASNHLAASKVLLAGDEKRVSARIDHLLKEKTYQMVVIADVVRKDERLDYLDNWYHLKTSTYASMTLMSNDAESVYHHAMCSAIAEVVPSNQIIQMGISPITYNGFLILKGTDDFYQINASIDLFHSFKLQSLQGEDQHTVSTRTSFPNGSDIVVPFMATYADASIPISIEQLGQDGRQIITFDIKNEQHKPIVVIIDCQSQSILDTQTF